MMYSDFDYLWDVPYHVPNIGSVRCPTLLDIRHMTYNNFMLYVQFITGTKEDLRKALESAGITNISDDLTTFEMLLLFNVSMLFSLIRTFISNNVIKLNEENIAFDIYDIVDDKEVPIGSVNKDNFDVFRAAVSNALGIKPKEEKEKNLKFKSESARKLWEKIQKNKEKQQKENPNPNYVLDNMILKYCTHNKVGINLLNVGNLTYCQFIKLFNEFSYGRQVDYNDIIAGNTFSYKEAKDYDSTMWIKKIKDED